MNRTPLARRTQIIHCLVEGNSIRSTERMTDTHRDTIMWLLVEVGNGCIALAHDQMRNLNCRRIQCDEIWSYVGKKQAHLQRGDDRQRLETNGRSWPLTRKPSLFRPIALATRSRENAVAFMTDLSAASTSMRTSAGPSPEGASAIRKLDPAADPRRHGWAGSRRSSLLDLRHLQHVSISISPKPGSAAGKRRNI
jgi:hypothetical protein